MSFAYLPLFTGDYLRDTRACSMAEHGAYLLLLIHCWDTRDPVPLDEREAAGICNARSGDELEAMRRVLKRYFVQMADGWYNRRMQVEIERSQSISNARSEAGKMGYQAKAKQMPSKSRAKAKQMPLSPTSTSTSTSTPKSEALAPSPAPQDLAAADPAVISIPLNDNTEYPIKQSQIDEWKALYGDCDVDQTLREIRGWNLANPTKRKTKAGILNHVNRWLAKEHNRG